MSVSYKLLEQLEAEQGAERLRILERAVRDCLNDQVARLAAAQAEEKRMLDDMIDLSRRMRG